MTTKKKKLAKKRLRHEIKVNEIKRKYRLLDFKHGEPTECQCGAKGTKDNLIDDKFSFDDSVWYNEKTHFQECYRCWLK